MRLEVGTTARTVHYSRGSWVPPDSIVYNESAFYQRFMIPK
jgi:hypothetical protein